jgi:uncharacterized phiE125 gp8 family phage protein
MFWSIAERSLGLSTPARTTVIQPPTSEPLTLAEAKRQVYVAESDPTHDTALLMAIQGAREQWEQDTDSAVMTQTLSVSVERFSRELMLRRPVQLIESISYYRSDGEPVFVDPDDYAADASGRLLFTTSFTYPSLFNRHDAVTVTYVAGHPSRSHVPAVAKQAMLLLIGYYFEGNRGDNDRPNDRRAYEALVTKFMRSSYP